MAQQDNMQQSYGSGLASYGMSFPATPQIQPGSDEVRLLLQLAADQGGSFSSYPSELSGAVLPAEKTGWLSSYSPPSTPIKDKDGVVVGASSNGFVTWILTDDGRKELGDRNARLGAAATRMAHGTQFVPGVGVVVYGAARRVPLNQPFHLQDGGVVSR
jgi:hypothetical protein